MIARGTQTGDYHILEIQDNSTLDKASMVLATQGSLVVQPSIAQFIEWFAVVEMAIHRSLVQIQLRG